MRFIHTSDWHIGRQLHERSLLEDQEYILRRFLELVKDSEVDAVIIAGDIYDRAVPPKEAIRLLDHVMNEIVLGMNIPVFMISGNHDSPERLGFGSRLLSSHRLHIVSSVEAMLEPLILEDSYGAVHFHGIPYFDPPVVRMASQDESVHDHPTAMKWCVNQILNRIGRQPTVAVAHAFVAGDREESSSERPLSIGGSSAVDPALFHPFCYTALGHLHRRQQAGSPKIRYSGSILSYGFDEASGDKSISVIELGETREPKTESIELQPRRHLRTLQGDFSELLKKAAVDPNPQDYIEILREDNLPILDPMGKMRAFYPNILHIERIQQKRTLGALQLPSRSAAHESLNPEQIFERFFQEVEGQSLSAVEQTVFRQSLGVEL